MKKNYKQSIIKSSAIFIICLLIVSFAIGCSSLSHYKISKDYKKYKYKRVGLLVCRMGNKHEGVLSPITLETDYSNRIYKRELSAGMVYMKEHKDIFIDDNKRMMEGFPNYPVYRCYNGPNSSKQCKRFYKNITSNINATLKEVLNDKGYEVIDIKKTAKTWNPPFSEMKIDKIIDKVGRDIDALLVFHYFDVGTNEILTDLWYRLAVFDVNTKKNVIDFQSFYFDGVVATLFSDKEIPPGKIVVLDQNKTEKQIFSQSTSISQIKWISKTTKLRLSIRMSEKEIIEYAMKYLRYGFKSQNNHDRGLESIIP